MRLVTNLRNSLDKPITTPVILFLICLITYGLYLPWMGFYWDDWPWIWQFQVYGPQAIREIDAAFRPLAGVVLWLGARLAGTNATGWQVYNFIIRWLGGVALWWALRQIWPKKRVIHTWITILFLVYTGFGQQFVSINSSRHLFPLITFFLSLGATGKAAREAQRQWQFTAAAVALSVVTMFTTEYYYGLELIRLGILGKLTSSKEGQFFPGARKVLKAWWPYLIPLIGVFAWRFAASQQVNYEVVLVNQLQESPLDTVAGVISTALGDLVEVSLGSWISLFNFPAIEVFGPRKTTVYWGVVILGSFCTFLYTSLLGNDPGNRRWSFEVISLGGAAVLVSGLPFWATGLEVKMAFPNDRLTLPMMMGVSMLAAGLLDLIKPKIPKNIALALITGLSIGAHFQNAASYQRDWETQASFFQQLTWRIPGLVPGTAVLSPELPVSYSTDNSLTAPLNWIYAFEQPAEELPYGLLYLDLRLGTKITALKPGIPITMDYGPASFKGNTSQAIIVAYAPPACLRVLDPTFDANLPGNPNQLARAVPLSNLNQVQVNPRHPAILPENIYGVLPSPTTQWCYYFQKADLARQTRSWEQIAALGAVAFGLTDSPNHASERVPFIEGFAHVGDWDSAINLTLEAIRINKFMGPMLCDTWTRILDETADTDTRDVGYNQVEEHLDCGLTP